RLLAAPPEPAPVLYAVVLETHDYVVGAANASSGLFRYEGDARWTHLGWPNVRANALAADPARPDTLLLAAGNGLLRSYDGGASWRVATGWEVTEVQDVAADPAAPADVYLATAHGLWRSADGGETWAEANEGVAPRFVQAVAVDRGRAGHVLAGGEGGLFRSADGGRRWARVGPEGVAVRALAQSPVLPILWLAGTEGRGLLRSTDRGGRWAFVGAADATFYAVAFDPHDALRMAAAGYQTGVYVSTDGGDTWTRHAGTLPVRDVYR